MKHADIQKLFQDWLEGRADESTRSLIRQHLDACGACRRYYETMSLLLEKPDRSLLPRLEPDPFLPARIEALAAAGPARYARAPRLTVLRASLATAVFVCAVAAGVFLGAGISTVLTSSYDDTAVVDAYSDALSQSGFADSWEEIVAYNSTNEEEQ